MKFILAIRNRIEEFYEKHEMLLGYAARFVCAFLSLFILSKNVNYSAVLSNILFVIGLSICCAFVPVRFTLLILVAYVSIQIFSLSIGVGVIITILFLLMYLIYFRFEEKYGFVLILVPLLSIIKLPLLVPLLLAAAAPFSSVIPALFGNVIYFVIRYLMSNSAVFLGMTETNEITKMSMVLTGIFTYKELLYTLACMLIMFIAVYLLKKINVNQSESMAIAAGAGIYLITIMISNLMFSTITSARIIWVVFGCVLSCLLAILIQAILLPLNYLRTEYLEFEDEEYHYFVRAVPKAAIEKRYVKIKRFFVRSNKENKKE